MAVSSKETGNVVGAGTRFAIGANVVLSVVVATALLIAVNLLASYRNVREDLASVGNYGLSERTRHILDSASGDIEMAIVYEPNDKDEKQREYIERLQEYCDELSGYSSKVKVTHVATDRQREQLVAEIAGSVGGEAEKHRAAMEAFERLRADLEAELSQRVAEAMAIRSNKDAWLSGFPLFERVFLKLQDMREQIGEVQNEIKELTPPGGLPKYGEAAGVAKAAIETLTKDFKEISKLMEQFTSLARETTRTDSDYIGMLRDVSNSVRGIATKLRDAVGGEDAEPPADLKAPLKDFADACIEVAGTLNGLVGRVDRFADAFPIVTQHADWSDRVQSGPLVLRVEVSGVLQEIGRSLETMRLQVLGILDNNDADQLQAALVGVRRNTSSVEQNIAFCEQILTSLADSLSKMDAESQALLNAAGDGGLFASTLTALETVKQQLDELPELTLGDIADKLREPNTIVVQAGDKLRVVPFDEVWPVRSSLPGADEDEAVRAFNGDSAISSALLALTAAKKFANVVFVGYEPPPPQQRSPFAPPPPRSSIPMGQTNLLRERLMASNCTVFQWNLAEQPDPPVMEEGLKTIYVFMPPAPPAQQNPFGPQTPQQSFGEPERQKIRDILAAGGRGIFLAGWELIGSPMGGPPIAPEYGYNPILESWYGLHVDNSTRVINVERDTKTEHGVSIGLKDIQWLPVIGFSDSPIGKSMRGTRSLVASACVIDAAPPTDDAEHSWETVLRIPDRESYIGTSPDELMKIFAALNDPRVSNVIDLKPRPKTEIDGVLQKGDDGQLSLPLEFVPPFDAKSVLVTIDGTRFRAPIEPAPSHWLTIPSDVVAKAGIQVGEAIEIALTIPGQGEPTNRTIKTTIQQEAPYRIVIPTSTVQEIAGYVREDEIPVTATINNHVVATTLRSADGESWIPLSSTELSDAKLEAGNSANVELRIQGIHDKYYPTQSFSSSVTKVEARGYRAEVEFNPNAMLRFPNQQIQARIKDQAFDTSAFEIGGAYHVPLYQQHLADLSVRAGEQVHAAIELITAETPSPFDLVVAATRKAPKPKDMKPESDSESTKTEPDDSRIVVMSIGQSFTDAYLQQPVVADFEKIRFDPAPTENLDLLVNAVYWLNDTPEYIGRGPVPVPRINAISSGDQRTIRMLLFGIWPALVLAPGIVLWFLRRR